MIVVTLIQLGLCRSLPQKRPDGEYFILPLVEIMIESCHRDEAGRHSLKATVAEIVVLIQSVPASIGGISSRTCSLTSVLRVYLHQGGGVGAGWEAKKLQDSSRLPVPRTRR